MNLQKRTRTGVSTTPAHFAANPDSSQEDQDVNEVSFFTEGNSLRQIKEERKTKPIADTSEKKVKRVCISL